MDPGGDSHMKVTGMLVASRFGVEIAFFWSYLGYSKKPRVRTYIFHG